MVHSGSVSNAAVFSQKMGNEPRPKTVLASMGCLARHEPTCFKLYRRRAIILQARAALQAAGLRRRAPMRVRRSSRSHRLKGGFTQSALGVSSGQYDAFRYGVASIERKGKYGIMGGSSGRFAGAYQMGGAEIRETAKRLGEDAPSRRQFLTDKAMQERFFNSYTADHDRYLMRHSKRYAGMSGEQRLQVLGYAHNQGAGGAANGSAPDARDRTRSVRRAARTRRRLRVVLSSHAIRPRTRRRSHAGRLPRPRPQP
jgi:hypothetical protein